MLIINQLKVSINDNTDDLSNAISKKLRISVEDLIKYEIIKRSIDARKKHDIYFVYKVYVSIQNESNILSRNFANVEPYNEKDKSVIDENIDYNKNRVIKIGEALPDAYDVISSLYESLAFVAK